MANIMDILGGAAGGFLQGGWGGALAGALGSMMGGGGQASAASKQQAALLQLQQDLMKKYGIPAQDALQLALQGMTSGNQANIPAYLRGQPAYTGTSLSGMQEYYGVPVTPDWQNPYTAAETSHFLDTGVNDINATAQGLQSNLTSSMARRGLGGVGGTSSADRSLQAMASLVKRVKLADLTRSLDEAKRTRSDALRGESYNALTTLSGVNQARQGQNAQNYFNTMNSMTSGLSNMLGNYQNIGNTYGNIATNAGNAVAQSNAGLMSALGKIWGSWGT